VGVGEVMDIRLNIEIWIVGKGDTKRVWEKRRLWGKRYWGCWVLWPLCMFECISVVVVDGADVRGYSMLGGWGCVQ
jgi:hypothetical protein